MRQEYVQSTRYAFVGHAVIIAVAVVLSFWHGWLRQPREIPVEFTVVLDPGRMEMSPEDKSVAPTPKSRLPDPIPEPDPPPSVPPVPVVPVNVPNAIVSDNNTDKPPTPKPSKTEIKIGPRIVRQASTSPRSVRTTQPRLSASEIERLLKLGATPGVRNTIPDDEVSRCMLLIKRALYTAWDPPSRVDAGAQPAELELRFGVGGRIINTRLIKPSGNVDYDRSVIVAAAALDHVDGLTASFLKRYDRLTVEFKLDDDLEP